MSEALVSCSSSGQKFSAILSSAANTPSLAPSALNHAEHCLLLSCYSLLLAQMPGRGQGWCQSAETLPFINGS